MKTRKTYIPSDFNHPIQLTSIQNRPAILVRQNLNQINKSMQNIERMIERSRSIIKSSRLSRFDDNHPQKQTLENNYRANSPKNVQQNSKNTVKKESEMTKTEETQKKSYHLNCYVPKNSNESTHKIKTTRRIVEAKGSKQTNKLLSQYCSARQNPKIIKLTRQNQNSCVNKQNKQKMQKARLLQIEGSIEDKRNNEKNSFYAKLQKQANRQFNTIFNPISSQQQANAGTILYKFSPQKTNREHYKEARTMQLKTNNRVNQKKIITIKANRSIQMTHEENKQVHQIKSKMQMGSIKRTLDKSRSNILIEDEDNQPIDKTLAIRYIDKSYFKTQYSNCSKGDIDEKMETIQFEANGITTFEDQNKIQTLNTPTTIETRSSYLPTFYSIQKQAIKPFESISYNNEHYKKEQFLLKIKKYGFVQKYLSEQQIDRFYARLKQSKIPEVKWPIAVVDEVYKKIKKTKV